MYKRRYLESQIINLSKTFPILLLTGARQVGKTTLLKHISQQTPFLKHHYVSLDEFEIRSLAKNDPGLFLQRFPAPLIIDEIQYAPQLFPYLKAEVERKKKMGSYWLTGSQQFHLMKNVSESLAGRVGIVKLLGISQAEEKEAPFEKCPWSPDRIKVSKDYESISILQIFKKIVRGSFPRLLHRNAPGLDAFYGSYVQTYIDRDLRDLVKVSSLSSFDKFIRVCAARTASVLNLSDLARDSDISVNTAKEWLSLLESGGQIFLLRPYYKNITKRLIKAPKLYFLDTGLVCYLTGWRDSQTASGGAFAGQLFETFLIGEIVKSYLHRGIEPRIFYFRTKEKIEVDLLIEKNGKLLPVEIKLSSSVRSGDIKGITFLKKTNFTIGNGAVLAPTHQACPLSKDLFIIPPDAIS
jgi:predicted AAA+ superfamily ATPase